MWLQCSVCKRHRQRQHDVHRVEAQQIAEQIAEQEQKHRHFESSWEPSPHSFWQSQPKSIAELEESVERTEHKFAIISKSESIAE